MQCIKEIGNDARLLFHKELKQSDVGNLGRIVLPKVSDCLRERTLASWLVLDTSHMYYGWFWTLPICSIVNPCTTTTTTIYKHPFL